MVLRLPIVNPTHLLISYKKVESLGFLAPPIHEFLGLSSTMVGAWKTCGLWVPTTPRRIPLPPCTRICVHGFIRICVHSSPTPPNSKLGLTYLKTFFLFSIEKHVLIFFTYFPKLNLKSYPWLKVIFYAPLSEVNKILGIGELYDLHIINSSTHKFVYKMGIIGFRVLGALFCLSFFHKVIH
jgi:hypothetical protein